MNTIHIGWEGPFTLPEIKTMNQLQDYGIYQIYGPHPTYCKVELLYIGLAGLTPNSTFGVRIPNHTDWIECTRDSSQTSIYVGRLMGDVTPENSVWTRQIQLAEGLLIYAHYPTYNRQKDGAVSQPEFYELRVFNWGSHRDLLPEISGARLGKMPNMKPYGSLEMNLEKSLQPAMASNSI